MLGFHIDMNVGQFKADYLEKWLKELAALGYDTIIWEVENNIQWQTCPKCVSPDAFTKEEFKNLLNLCNTLGLECIPLLQTLGHCEYVLKHSEYRHFAELPDRIDQYCPSHPELSEFLKKWIDEYLSLFGNVKTFHIGADEAFNLGKCPHCADFAKKYSLSELYIRHINTISRYLIDKNIQPIIWADMILKHPEHIDKLSNKIIMADWMYDIYRENGKVWIWGEGLKSKKQINNKTLKTFGEFLFPNGNKNEQELETFYTSDFLAKHGFETITCPSSSSYGDNVFAPRHCHHTKNIYDSIKKGISGNLSGSILTSWTIHLFPWELQKFSIELAASAAENTSVTIEEYQKLFVKKYFDVDDISFFDACQLLAKTCLFSYSGTLGFDKSTQLTCKKHVQKTLQELAKQNLLKSELDNCRSRLKEYEQSLKIMDNFAAIAKKGYEIIYFWQLAAKNLINRANVSIYLLKTAINILDAKKTYIINKHEIINILNTLQNLKIETTKIYDTILKPQRQNELIHWIYDIIEETLKDCCNNNFKPFGTKIHSYIHFNLSPL
jgi:hypothetical protein